jgi:O-antigen/teichoic acid export membrane protein
VLTWVFQARDQMHVVSVAAVIRQVPLAAGVLLLVHEPSDVWMVPVWDGIGLGVAVALQVGLFLRGGGSVNPLRFLSGLKRILAETAPIAGSSVVWAIRLFAPLLALGFFTTSENVGVFGAGHRLVISGHTFVWLYFFNLLPSLSRLGTEPGLRRFQDLFHTSMRLVGWIAICGASIGAVLSGGLIPLVYGDGLAAATGPFAVMVWGLAAAFVSGHHRFSLVALSLQRDEFWASLVGSAVSVVACLAMGSRLTPVTAAWVFVAAELTTLLVATAYLRRSVPELPVLAGLLSPIAFTAVGVGLLNLWAPDSTLVAAAFLTVLYCGGIYAFERDGFKRLIALRGGPDRV